MLIAATPASSPGGKDGRTWRTSKAPQVPSKRGGSPRIVESPSATNYEQSPGGHSDRNGAGGTRWSCGKLSGKVMARGSHRGSDGGGGRCSHGCPALPARGLVRGQGGRIITQHSLETMLAAGNVPAGCSHGGDDSMCGSRATSYGPIARGSAVCRRVKNAVLLKESRPNVRVLVVHRDIRTYGTHELSYARARELGVLFLRTAEESVPKLKMGHPLWCGSGCDPETAVGAAYGFDCAFRGRSGRSDKFPTGSSLETSPGKRWILLGSPHETSTGGVCDRRNLFGWACPRPKALGGNSHSGLGGCRDVAAALLAEDHLRRAGTVAEVTSQRCAACLTCVRVCPYHVPKISAAGVAEIDPMLCQGCGTCAAKCPRRAIELRHFADDQLLAKVEVLWEEQS